MTQTPSEMKEKDWIDIAYSDFSFRFLFLFRKRTTATSPMKVKGKRNGGMNAWLDRVYTHEK